MLNGPSIVFTRKVVVVATLFHKSSNICESIGEIDAKRLHPLSLCQPMPTGLSPRYELDEIETQIKQDKSFWRDDDVLFPLTQTQKLRRDFLNHRNS